VGPIAFIIEKAGGASHDGKASVLESEITSADARTPVAFGSPAEVQRTAAWLQGAQGAA
jgi:fructose-1,6-bisphosphatase